MEHSLFKCYCALLLIFTLNGSSNAQQIHQNQLFGEWKVFQKIHLYSDSLRNDTVVVSKISLSKRHAFTYPCSREMHISYTFKLDEKVYKETTYKDVGGMTYEKSDAAIVSFAWNYKDSIVNISNKDTLTIVFLSDSVMIEWSKYFGKNNTEYFFDVWIKDEAYKSEFFKDEYYILKYVEAFIKNKRLKIKIEQTDEKTWIWDDVIKYYSPFW